MIFVINKTSLRKFNKNLQNHYIRWSYSFKIQNYVSTLFKKQTKFSYLIHNEINGSFSSKLANIILNNTK